MVAPASRFSKTMETGNHVAWNTNAPLTLPGMLSTAGHCDQSRFAMRLHRYMATFYSAANTSSACFAAMATYCFPSTK